MQIEASDWLSGKKLTLREAINDLSKADRPISLMEPLITDRQTQVTDQACCLTCNTKKSISLIKYYLMIQNYVLDYI